MNTIPHSIRTLIATTSTLALATALSLSSALAETTAAGDYKIDPAHTSVTFVINHLGISQLAGRFNKVEGKITIGAGSDASVSVEIDTASVDTNHKKRDDHLRSPDFFNARQFPEIKFTADHIQLGDDGPTRIEGKLTLHGKTRTVTLAVEPVGAGKDPWGGYRAGYIATTTIKRSDYGMNFMPGGIGDKVAVTLNIEAIKQ